MSTTIYEAQAAGLRGLKPSEKVVALVLAARMNSKLPGWGGRPVAMPKIDTIANDSELDNRTVSRAIATLAERGIIDIVRFRKPNGHLGRNHYVWTAETSDAYVPNWMATSDPESSDPLERMTPEQEAAAAKEGVHPLTWIQEHTVDMPATEALTEEEVTTEDSLPIDIPPRKKLAHKPANGFAEWWAQYPKKVKKLDAEKAYKAALKRGVTPKELLDGLQRQKAAWKAKGTEPQYIPYPATWLRAGSWEDELETPAPSMDNPAPVINPVTGKEVTRKDFWYACIEYGIDPSGIVNFWTPSMGLPGDPGWAEQQAFLDRHTGRA